MGDFEVARPAGIKRVVFKEIVAGDLLKFQAESNEAETGGGARDLRFRPYDRFDEIFARLFPITRNEPRRRGGAMVEVRIRTGQFTWQDERGTHLKDVTFEPPTDARPNEGRISMVHTIPSFATAPAAGEGRVVLLLVQRDDDTVWPHFATETSLRSGRWHAAVSKAILECLEAPRAAHSVARGYLDFEDKRRFCDV